MSANLERFHVIVNGKRTTVSLNFTLAWCFAIYLGCEPGSEAGYQEVKAWLQRVIDRNRYSLGQTSQWCQEQIILEMVDNKISKRFYNWVAHTDYDKLKVRTVYKAR